MCVTKNSLSVEHLISRFMYINSFSVFFVLWSIDGKIQIRRKNPPKNAKWHDSRYSSSSINLSKALDGFDLPEWRIDPIFTSRLESVASYGGAILLEWWWITRHLSRVCLFFNTLVENTKRKLWTVQLEQKGQEYQIGALLVGQLNHLLPIF